MHQWGMALPGGCEAMIHWRDAVHQLAIDGTIAPLVCFDLDLKNMFGNIEWPNIRASIQKQMPEALAWTKWAHERKATTVLPGGDEAQFDRGATQGDPLGTAQSVLPLGDTGGGYQAFCRSAAQQSRGWSGHATQRSM